LGPGFKFSTYEAYASGLKPGSAAILNQHPSFEMACHAGEEFLKILVINCGSSSLKYKLFEMPRGEVLARGEADRIGQPDAGFTCLIAKGVDLPKKMPLRDHRDALGVLLQTLTQKDQGVLKDLDELAGIGHRVVHGGEHFRFPVRIDENVRMILERLKNLAPLHNPPNLAGIDICAELLPQVPQIAVFDTAFHQTIPDYAYLYALPYRYYQEDHIRKYGFHGTSHRYVALRAGEILGRDLSSLRIITCHLGNGSSLCAVSGARSLDTTMGFTPLSGLVMGTRCGDIDPALVAFLSEKEGLSVGAVMDILNRQSGVLGISGLSQDLRDLEKAALMGHQRADLALNVFAYSVAKGIASLIPAIGGLDVLVFTAGIGEHSPDMRERICAFFQWLGLSLNKESNWREDAEGKISRPGSLVEVLVIPTDEEKMIAQETAIFLKKSAS
jgi:acetate kinase